MKKSSQFLRFLIVGGLATGLHYLILALLIAAGTTATAASASGFILSAICNFFLSHRYTFQSTLPLGSSLWRYTITAGSGCIINTAAFTLMHDRARLAVISSQIMATMIVMAWNFYVGRNFSFSSDIPRKIHHDA